ncbi:MAG: lytic transglycosylase domain-containing protein [Thermodesulfobacteriota bacterium]|nr:lytic transglycosylase domain-containing protein [Thermodesulfobacteriota bacterium]
MENTGMYIKYDNFAGIKLNTPNIYQASKGDGESSQGNKNRVKSFNTWLQSSMIDGYSNINLSPEGLSLDKNAVNKLIQIIQAQIDYSLVKTVTGDTSYGNLWGQGNLPVLDVSKIRHPYQPKEEMSPKMDLDHIIDHASNCYNVDRNLITSVIKAESDFDAKCTSKKGAMGLMQLMPETAKELGVENPYDPYENIMAGTKYLKGLLRRYDNDTNSALAAYNWGMGNLERNPGKLPSETRTYIARVNKFYQNAKSHG